MRHSDRKNDADPDCSHALSEDDFLAVVDKTPLVSIDLVVVDPERHMLVGKRTNDPAQGTWFVPGGRIKKGETLDRAFTCISNTELGSGEWRRDDAQFLGVFNHFYETNFAEVEGISTHYIVLAYLVESGAGQQDQTIRDQHSEYAWIAPADMKVGVPDMDIHPYTVAYADHVERMLTAQQYGISNARKDALNAQLWQTPVLTLTGLAFVFTVLLSTTSNIARWIAALLAMVISFAALQLFTRHRLFEHRLSKQLQHHEELAGLALLNSKPPDSTDWLARRESGKLWKRLFVFFTVAALVAAIALTIWQP